MSSVSTVVIVIDDYEKEEKALLSLNEWLKEHGHLGNVFNPIDGGNSAGTKYPEKTVVWGGLNYLNEEEFISFFKKLNLDNSLLVMGSPDDDSYKVVKSNTVLEKK
jgi:hypothetical protein